MDIVLDANILIADYRLSGTAFRVTLDGIRRTDCKLLISEVVLAEVVAKYRDDLCEAVEQERKARRTIDRLTGRGAVVPSLDVGAETEHFADHLRGRLIAAGARILPWPLVPHEAVVQRILSGRPPTRKDAGYRDTLIWESLLAHVVSARPKAAVLVTANARDFCEGEGLHPHLAKDLVNAGFTTNFVEVETSLTGLNKRVFEPMLGVLDEAKEKMARGAYRGIDLRVWLADHLRGLIDGDHLRGAASDLPDGCGGLHLSSKAEVRSLKVDDVRKLSNDELLVELRATIIGDVSISLDADDYERFAEARAWIGRDYSGGSVSISASEEFTGTFELIVGDGNVLASELTGMDGSYGEWTLSRRGTRRG